MSAGRAVLSSLLALSLAACGGGGSGGNSGSWTGTGSTGGTTGGTGTGSTSGCTLSSRQDWVLSQLNEWYLFPDLLNTTVNKAAYSSLQDYVDALVAPARAQSKDRYFTYVTSIAEENALINSGANAGFGVRLSYDEAARTVFVVEAFENAPALAAGIDRGTEILAINGQMVSTLMATGGSEAVSSALGPSTPGLTRTLQIRSPDGTVRDVTVAKASYDLDPISDRYGVRVFDADGTKVGYLNLRTFIVQSADQQLRDAFQQFKDQGVTRVILDLRYNGGGLISVAETLGDLLGANHTGQVFSRTLFRDTKASNNETRAFGALPQGIAPTRIAVIGREGTASASELVTNAFIPYLGAGIGLIGTNTYGKPVGQIALDRSACDDRLRAIALRTVNASNGGDYYQGLASVMQASCQAPDGIEKPLGDPAEASIAVALDYLAGRSCTAIAGAGSNANVAAAPAGTSGSAPSTTTGGATSVTRRSPRGEGPRHILLRSRGPTAAQYEVPGLF